MNFKIVTLMIIPMLFSCTKRSYDFYFASLVLDENLTVTERKKLRLENLSGNSIVPFAHVLEKNDYIIRVEIVENSYTPSLRVFVKPSENELSLRLIPKRNMSQKGKHGVVCSSFYEHLGEDSIGFDMGWSVDCKRHIKDKAITFDVLTNTGELIETETIKFELFRDGKYWLVDAI